MLIPTPILSSPLILLPALKPIEITGWTILEKDEFTLDAGDDFSFEDDSDAIAVRVNLSRTIDTEHDLNAVAHALGSVRREFCERSKKPI